MKIQKAIEQERDCQFIRIDPDKEDFDFFKTINDKFRRIKQSTKQVLINKILRRLLGLELQSDNIIKSKTMKFIVKKYFLIISNNGHPLCQL